LPQDVAVEVWHVPVPLQVRAEVSVDPVQLAATHVVPLAYRRHPPPPSHVPSVPQVEAPWSLHWPSGSWPAPTRVQVPAVPDKLQERQLPVHAEMQHDPCSQKPLAHSVAAAQVAPFGFFEQVVPLQTFGETQSAVVAQLVKHTPPEPQT
jgi:hypothetical protein